MMVWILSSSALILGVAILRLALRGRVDERLQYALWLLVLARLLIPVQLIALPSGSGGGLWNAPSGVQNGIGSDREGAQSGVLPGETGTPPAAAALQPDIQTVQGAVPDTDAPDGADWPAILRMVWYCGMAVSAAVLLAGNMCFYQKLRRTRRRLEVPCPIPVYECAHLASPCLVGTVRPAVYLNPSSRGEGRLAYILKHELAHYRHGDGLWSLLRCVCLIVHWYNPFVWLAAVLSRRDAELACDRSVISGLEMASRAAYGRTLLGMAAERSGMHRAFCIAADMADGKKALEMRLRAIVRTQKRTFRAAVLCAVLAIGLAGCAFSGAEPGGERDDDVITIGQPQNPMFYVSSPDAQAAEQLRMLYSAAQMTERGAEAGAGQCIAARFDDSGAEVTWEVWPDGSCRVNGGAYMTMENGRSIYWQLSDLYQGLLDVRERAAALYEKKTPYIGDAPACGALLEALGTGRVGSYTMEITDENGMIIHLEPAAGLSDADIHAAMGHVGSVFLALVENAERFEWRCFFDGREVHGAAEAEQVKKYGENPERFCAFLMSVKDMTLITDSPADMAISLSGDEYVMYGADSRTVQAAWDALRFMELEQSTAKPSTEDALWVIFFDDNGLPIASWSLFEDCCSIAGEAGEFYIKNSDMDRAVLLALYDNSRTSPDYNGGLYKGSSVF